MEFTARFDSLLGSSVDKTALTITMSETKMSFLDKIKDMKLTEFSFTRFDKTLTTPKEDGSRATILLFSLDEPIEKVIGSNAVYSPIQGRRVNPITTDVITIHCSLELVAKYHTEFKFEEDEDGKLTLAGSYSGDMFLDISNAEEVWLTDTKFSKMSSDWKNSKKEAAFQNFLKKHEDQLAARK